MAWPQAAPLPSQNTAFEARRLFPRLQERTSLAQGAAPLLSRAGSKAAWRLGPQRGYRHDNAGLGSRLIQHQQMIAAAMATAEAKLLASLSYLVWMRRQSFSRLKVRSMAFRAR